MKLFLILLLGITFLIPAMGHSGILSDQKTQNKKMLDTQKAEDKKNREEIVRKYRTFLSDMNKQLGFKTKTKIDAPVDMDKTTDIKKTDQVHTRKPVPPKEFAFVNVKSANLRSEPFLRSTLISKAAFQEKLQVVIQSEDMEKIEGIEAKWIMVRKAGGEEGWIFGAYIQKEIPETEKDFTKPADKSAVKPGAFMVPTAGFRSSNFGYRINPITKKSDQFHSGIDIAAPMGTPVKASADGVVRIAEFNNNGYGNLVVIEHEKDVSTYYGHMSRIAAKAGLKVARGDLIGYVGSTGWSTGPHLHFEVRKGGSALNPDEFIAMLRIFFINLIS